MMQSTSSSRILNFVLIIAIITASCSKAGNEILPEEPVQIQLSKDQTAVIQSANSFAFNIFARVIQNSQQNENLLISPLSISSALSMTVNGANGPTRDAILEALELTGARTEFINSAYKVLSESLATVDKRVNMSIANSIWSEDDFEVKQAFIDVLTEYYKADSKLFDINDPQAPDIINAWIEDKTNGLIKNMVEKLNDNTVMLLINAIYFKGKWKSEFDKSKTTELPFYRPDGSQVVVPMMKQKSEFRVLNEDGFILAEFPYGQGNFVMDVLVPSDPSDFSKIFSLLNSTEYDVMVNKMTSSEIDLTFPRFKYGYKKGLKNILTDMGMGIAFTDDADFLDISEQFDLLINDVTHQSFIETNEEGTEAAAATIVDIGVTSAPPPPFVLNLDHPFIYFLRETTTNAIIFMGRISDPSVH